MINRVLIRIKVIQLLYSYLLIENRFMLESQPAIPTREKRFAYSLYLDMLVLMVKISENVEKRGGYRPLDSTRFIREVASDEQVKSLMMKYRIEDFPFQSLVGGLSDLVKESGLYKTFLKNMETEKPENEQVWENLFNILIMPNPALNAAIAKRADYSLGGVERMKEMMADTFRNLYASRDNIDDALRTLAASMDKARELYFRLLTLPVELTKLRYEQLEANRNKFIPTAEDLNPNMRFVENALVAAIADNEEVNAYVEKNKISWLADDRILMENLLKAIMESEIYKEYMEFPATDFHRDCEFWKDIFKQVISENVDFLDFMENKSVFWNDDLEIIGTFFLKTIKRFEDEKTSYSPILPMYKDDEDAMFGKTLFADVVRNKEEYRRYIDECVHSEKWDSERLAFMDVVITMTALAEILKFPKIPTVVSINEYIEIAKSYSTSKSGAFVNGLLYAIVEKLRAENKLHKK